MSQINWGKTVAAARASGMQDAEIAQNLTARNVPPETISGLLAGPVQKDIGDIVTTAVGNIPASAKQFAYDVTAPIHSPVQTVKGLYGLGRGAVEKLIPGEQPHEANIDAVWNMMKERYGGKEAFIKTIEEDPIGALSDLSMVLTMGGTTGVKTAQMAGKTGGIAKTVAAAGKAMDPLNLARASVVPLTSKIPKSLPESLYNKAAKFSSRRGAPDPHGLARTALDEGLEPTFKGVSKAKEKINLYNNKIDELIGIAEETGRPIPKRTLMKYLDDLKEEAKLHPDISGKRAEVDAIKMRELADAKEFDTKELTASQLQEYKKNLYKEIKFDRQTEKALTMFGERSYREIARAAREQLEKLHPEIKGLNQAEGAIIELVDELENAAKRIDKHNILSLRTSTAATAGAAAGGVQGLIMGLAAGVIDLPKVQIKLAQVLDKARKTKVVPELGTAAKRQAAFQTGRAKTELQQQGLLGPSWADQMLQSSHPQTGLLR